MHETSLQYNSYLQ